MNTPTHRTGAVPEQSIDGVKRFLAERIGAEAAAAP